MLKHSQSLDYVTSVDLWSYIKISAYSHFQRKKQTTNAMGAVDNMGDVLLGKSDKDTNITLDSPKLKMQIAKVGGENGKTHSICMRTGDA